MGLQFKSLLRTLLPRKPAIHRIKGGPLRGHKIVTSWHDYPRAILGTAEGPLLDWFARNVEPGETWLDVGANCGYTALALSREVGPTGRVFAFEPLLGTAAALSDCARLNGMTQLVAVPAGLADPEGSLSLERAPTTKGMIDPRAKSDWLEPMQVAALDWLWPRICGGDHRVDGVKLDVQGMEIAALHGMRSVLKERRPCLVVEVHPGVSREDLLALLAGLGYPDPGVPIEPVEGEVTPRYIDDRSYSFAPRGDRPPRAF